MTETNWLIDRMAEWAGRTAMVWQDRAVSYDWLGQRVAHWQRQLTEAQLPPGSVIALEADYSPEACAFLIALVLSRHIVVPLTNAAAAEREKFMGIAQVEAVASFDAADQVRLSRRGCLVDHPLLLELRRRKAPGLVLFSSGSTGESKAALHDFSKLLEKFRTPRRRYTTISFLLLDHIGGINTLFYTLSTGGTVVALQERDPRTVCQTVERHAVELLPTSPTFLNLLLMSEQYREFDLSSLQLVTYGTEVMPESTLRRIHDVLPQTQLQQTYGLSELGILRSKSLAPDSLETKVVDGLLWIRAQSAMLGYLNAPSPFDPDGWFNTGDAVEVNGDYLRILGRRSEVINVGGQKVYPAEVESVLLQLENVADATVTSEKNPLVGNIVVARLNLKRPQNLAELKRQIKDHCRTRLEPFKVPVKCEVVEAPLFGARYKRVRSAAIPA